MLDSYPQTQLLFEGTSAVLSTMNELGARLSKSGIDYAVIGYPRYTVQLEILLTEEGHHTFKRELLGRCGFGTQGTGLGFGQRPNRSSSPKPGGC